VATNHRFMPVAPEDVWDVLADPEGYGHWVVGSKAIRDADPGFPAPGTRFHHTVGVGPFAVNDHTAVLEAEPGRRLRLRALARPLGTAKVTLELIPRDGGTNVRMTENPDGIYSLLALNPLVHVVTKLRNAESLARLERLATSRSGAGGPRARGA
jgi:uncharacterized protein YndB with AHSA1/START domain